MSSRVMDDLCQVILGILVARFQPFYQTENICREALIAAQCPFIS